MRSRLRLLTTPMGVSSEQKPMFRCAFPMLMIGASAQCFPQDARSADSQQERDVYAIYSLMLTNPQTSHGPDNNERYLIARTTAPGNPKEPCVAPPKEREADFREVLTDFERRKATPRQLQPAFSIDKPYELLSADEVREFIGTRFPKPGTETANPRYRGVSDLYTFSDVYFNPGRTLALTAISTWCGGLCAMYQWKVFEKLDSGMWEERRWTTCATMAGTLGTWPETRNSSLLSQTLRRGR
jgi:hypothetical protein